MKTKLIFAVICSAFILTSCGGTKVPTTAVYPESYEFKKESPLSILIMPPINKTNSVDAKDLFYAKMSAPVYGRGYYVFPPTLAMELMKREGVYDAEEFIDRPLNKFEELLGADAVLFSIIYDTDKSKLRREGMVDIEFIMKSTATNKVLYRVRGEYILDKSLYTIAEMNNDIANDDTGYGVAVFPVIYGALFVVDLFRTILMEEADVSGKVSGVALGNLPNGIYPPPNGFYRPPVSIFKNFQATELEKNGNITVQYKQFKEAK